MKDEKTTEDSPEKNASKTTAQEDDYYRFDLLELLERRGNGA